MSGGSPETAVADLPLIPRIAFESVKLMIGKPFPGDGEKPDEQTKKIGEPEPEAGIEIGEKYRNAQ